MALEQTTELLEMIDQLKLLSPQARKEAAAFIRSLAEREGIPQSPSAEERRRIAREMLASLPPLPKKDAEELIRLTQQAHDECFCPRCRQG